MSSLVVKSIDRRKIERAVSAYALELRRKHPEVERIIWFGSWVNGLPVPGSDVDICLIISCSDLIPRDRIPAYLPDGFPTGIDLCVFTHDEFSLLPERSPGLFQAVTAGREIKQ